MRTDLTRLVETAHDCQNCNSCSSGGDDRFTTPDLEPTNRIAKLQATKTSALLREVMAYENPSVIHRLVSKDGYTHDDATTIFEDVKRFLFLATTTTEPLAPTKRVDDGWHAFILHTIDYMQFCNRFFGHYVHHTPNPPGAPKGDGALLRRTCEIASLAFGDLSKNWALSPNGFSPELCVGPVDDNPRKLLAPTSSGDCSPTTNCESAPSDCALNRTKFPSA
jgi:hypothetical protein